MGAQYTRMAAMKQTALQATAIRLPHTILREQTADRFFFNPMENLSQTAGPSQAYNQFGSDGKGKACKNMRRLYIMMEDELPFK